MGSKEGATVTSRSHRPNLLTLEERTAISQDLYTSLRKSENGLLWSHGYPLALFLLLRGVGTILVCIQITCLPLKLVLGRDLLGCHLVSVFWPQKRAGKTWDGTSVLSAFPGNLFLQASDRWGDTEPERHFSFKVKLWPICFAHFSALS